LSIPNEYALAVKRRLAADGAKVEVVSQDLALAQARVFVEDEPVGLEAVCLVQPALARGTQWSRKDRVDLEEVGLEVEQAPRCGVETVGASVPQQPQAQRSWAGAEIE
jgi:hypothetical protein